MDGLYSRTEGMQEGFYEFEGRKRVWNQCEQPRENRLKKKKKVNRTLCTSITVTQGH